MVGRSRSNSILVSMIYYQFIPKAGEVKIPPEFTQYKCLILNEYKIDEEYRWTVSEHLVKTG